MGIVCVTCNTRFHFSFTMTKKNTNNCDCKYCSVRGMAQQIDLEATILNLENALGKKEEELQNTNSPIKILKRKYTTVETNLIRVNAIEQSGLVP